jgi:hypothetical protein
MYLGIYIFYDKGCVADGVFMSFVVLLTTSFVDRENILVKIKSLFFNTLHLWTVVISPLVIVILIFLFFFAPTS